MLLFAPCTLYCCRILLLLLCTSCANWMQFWFNHYHYQYHRTLGPWVRDSRSSCFTREGVVVYILLDSWLATSTSSLMAEKPGSIPRQPRRGLAIVVVKASPLVPCPVASSTVVHTAALQAVLLYSNTGKQDTGNWKCVRDGATSISCVLHLSVAFFLFALRVLVLVLTIRALL